MSVESRFSSENVLMSVCGHLALIAIMLTSFALVVDRAKLVAPDRVEILEIDLNAVQVGGDETVLHNVNADAEPDTTPEETEAPAPAPVPEPVEELSDEPISEPSLIEQEPVVPEVPEPEVKPVAEPQQSQEDKKEEAPKKKKTVIRVNRESVSLDRTLTVSVVDALRVAMTRCWNIDTSRPDISDIRAVAHLTMRKNGTVRDVWFESAARAETDPAFSYVLDTIRTAIDVCQPFRMLPENEFDKWEKIQLTFYPTQGKVM